MATNRGGNKPSRVVTMAISADMVTGSYHRERQRIDNSVKKRIDKNSKKKFRVLIERNAQERILRNRRKKNAKSKNS